MSIDRILAAAEQRPGPVLCLRCEEFVQPKLTADPDAPLSRSVWTLPVSERGFCARCEWLDGADKL